MSDKDIWAVLPVKTFGDAKQRLGGACTPALRAALARAMVEDVLAALAGARDLSGFVVVTVDPDAMALAERHGGRVITTAACAGQTAAIRGTAALLAAEGRGGMLTIPGDVPGILPSEIDRLIALHEPAPSFTIVPAHDRRGSNAIVVSPPDAVPLSFGNDSFQPHLLTARAMGLAPRIVELPGIGLDIDNPLDLEAFLAQPGSGRARAYLMGDAPEVPRGAQPRRTWSGDLWSHPWRGAIRPSPSRRLPGDQAADISSAPTGGMER